MHGLKNHARALKTGDFSAVGGVLPPTLFARAICRIIVVERGHLNGGHGNYTAEVVREVIAEYFGMNMQYVSEDMSAEYETEQFH